MGETCIEHRGFEIRVGYNPFVNNPRNEGYQEQFGYIAYENDRDSILSELHDVDKSSDIVEHAYECIKHFGNKCFFFPIKVSGNNWDYLTLYEPNGECYFEGFMIFPFEQIETFFGDVSPNLVYDKVKENCVGELEQYSLWARGETYGADIYFNGEQINEDIIEGYGEDNVIEQAKDYITDSMVASYDDINTVKGLVQDIA